MLQVREDGTQTVISSPEWLNAVGSMWLGVGSF